MAKDRGRYASQYCVQTDSPEWLSLSLDARACWYALKYSPENNTAGVFPYFREQVSLRSGVPLERVSDAFRELEKARWAYFEGHWVWLRNHLKHDPHFTPGNANNIKGLVKVVQGLPHIKLVRDFINYYNDLRGYFPQDFTHGALTPSKGLRRASRGATPGPTPPPPKPDTDTESVTEADTDTDTETEGRAVVMAYNAVFGTNLGPTPGNLAAARRALDEGYTLAAMRSVFEAVRGSTTATAAWCAENNREFEYLIRPAYRKRGETGLTYGPLDKIPNEIATGRKAG